MCGIFGSYAFASNDHSPENIRRIINRLKHRGPDEMGIWLSPDRRIALASRRLSLVGINAGQQPICNSDHSIVAVVNGEFYGHREIRIRLESEGHHFQSQTDSEIAVHLYREYGIEFVKYLRGEFALLLWDRLRQRMIAVRDRFGIKPLVYHESNESILFASEAKAILPEIQNATWDHEAFSYAALMQYLPQDRTLFAGIRLLPPGHLGIVENNQLTISKYWDFNYPVATESQRSFSQAEEEDAIKQVRRKLTASVLDRLDAEAPVCFHLSGGLDSSCALGIAAKHAGPQDAFSVCFDFNQGRYDESKVAQRTADFCNSRLHPVFLSDIELAVNLIPAAAASEGLAINGHLAAKFLLNRKIHQHGFKAAITGEGADEIFMGYSHLIMDWQHARQQEPSVSSNDDAHRSSVGIMLPHGDSLCTDQLASQLGFVPTFLQAKATLGFRTQSLIYDDVLKNWKSAGWEDPYSRCAASALATKQLQGRSHTHQSAWLWSKHALAGYILKTLGDGCEMASSIEGRLPFLDHELVESVVQLPLPMLINGPIEKQILRLAVKPFVTNEVYQRPKHPFASPPLLLSRSPQVTEFLQDQVESEPFRKQPFYCPKKTKDLIDRVPKMQDIERQVWDPILTMMISTLGIQQQLISR